MKQRQIIILISAIGIIAMGILLMKLFASFKPDNPPRKEAVLDRFVKASHIKYDTLLTQISATGRLSSASEVDLVAQAPGIIIEHNVRLKNGNSFTKGQILFEIDKEQQSLALKAQKSTFLNSLVGVLPDIKIDFEKHFSEFDTFLESIDLNKSLPVLPDVSNSKLKIFLASRGVLASYYSIKQQEVALSRHIVTAPFSGSFTQVNLEAGSFTNTGGKVAQIIRTDELEMEVPIDNSNSKWLSENQMVEIYSSSRNLNWTGNISRIANYVDAQTQSRSVFVKVKNKRGQQLLTGEYLTARFGGIKLFNSFEIPRNAVFNSNEVYIVVDDKLKKKTINIIQVNEETLFFNGISEGSYVVIEPLINVQENTAVKILKEENK